MNLLSRTLRILIIGLASFQMTQIPTTYAQTTKQDSINECNADPARTWDSRRNICIYTQESVDDRQEYRECANKATDEERKACHDNYAKSRSGDLIDDIEDDNMGMGLAGVNALLMAINVFSKGGTGGNCTSKTIHMATAGVGVLSELYFRLMARKEFDELVKQYEDQTVNEDPFAAQRMAFDFLENQQKKIADYSKKRKTAYLLLTLGYTAAAGMAAVELATTGMMGCGGSEGEDGQADNKPLEGEELADDAGLGAKSMNFMFPGGFSLNHPSVILIVSSVSALLSNKLRQGAAEQEAKAKENASKIAKIKAQFENALGEFCPSGHEDMGTPRCFCYTPGGDKNPDRSNSQTCQDLWAQDDKSLFAEAGSYGRGSEAKPGCFTVNNQFDQKCKCKKFKDDNGQNACLKTLGQNNVVPPNLQSAFSLPTTARSLDAVNSGTAAGSVNAQDLSSALAVAKRNKDKAVAKLNKKNKAEGKPLIPPAQKILDSLLRKSGTAPFVAAGNKNPSLGNAVPNNPAIAEALKEAEAKSGIEEVGEESAVASTPEKKKKGYHFSLDDEGNKVVNLGTEDLNDPQYDYGENDINDDPDQNLFEIITRRYNLSGLERLFDE